MKVKDKDGNNINWPPVGYTVNQSSILQKSSYHIEVRNLLQEIFPLNIVLEEVPLPLSPVLFLDFYIPSKKIAIEVNGAQHYEFNNFHFASKLDWLKSKSNDNKKSEWCQENNIELIILKFDEQDKWKEQLREQQ